MKLLKPLGADVVSDGVVGNHQLHRRDASFPILLRDQILRNDGVKGKSHLPVNLRLLRRREEVDDSVNGLRSVPGVNGREDEMAGLCRAECGGGCFVVAHLADENHVGVLAERGAQGVGEGR